MISMVKYVKNETPVDKAKGVLKIKRLDLPDPPSGKDIRKMKYINSDGDAVVTKDNDAGG